MQTQGPLLLPLLQRFQDDRKKCSQRTVNGNKFPWLCRLAYRRAFHYRFLAKRPHAVVGRELVGLPGDPHHRAGYRSLHELGALPLSKGVFDVSAVSDVPDLSVEFESVVCCVPIEVAPKYINGVERLQSIVFAHRIVIKEVQVGRERGTGLVETDETKRVGAASSCTCL